MWTEDDILQHESDVHSIGVTAIQMALRANGRVEMCLRTRDRFIAAGEHKRHLADFAECEADKSEQEQAMWIELASWEEEMGL